MPLQLDDLRLLDAPDPGEGGRPLLLMIDKIDEDPEQPRKEFDEDTLQELAATIAERGVRQPVSVRPHPDVEGRWVLNFGARRLRASKLAGKRNVPAFIDQAADSYDKMIENEQREPLKPLELALFVKRRIAAGESQTEIARRLGKSRQYITLATALIDAPDWVISAYRGGRCKGMTELYELRKLYTEAPLHVEAWASGLQLITRERLSALRQALSARQASIRPEAAMELALTVPRDPDSRRARRSRERRIPLTRLYVELEGAAFELVVDEAPATLGEVFIRPPNGDNRRAVLASQLKLLGFMSADPNDRDAQTGIVTTQLSSPPK